MKSYSSSPDLVNSLGSALREGGAHLFFTFTTPQRIKYQLPPAGSTELHGYRTAVPRSQLGCQRSNHLATSFPHDEYNAAI